MMKLIFFGGTGLIGQEVIRKIINLDYEILVVSRNVKKVTDIFGERVKAIQWIENNKQSIKSIFTGNYAVINLAGESIGSKIWTEKQKSKIINSRIKITETISEFINESADKPNVILQGSATGFYGSDPEKYFNEKSAKGSGFLSDLTDQWERSLMIDKAAKIRIVYFRTGVVLSNKGGMLPKLLVSFKFWIGGYIGNGRQWIPWIQIKDEINAIKYLLENQKSNGIYNLTSPQPIQMKTFCKLLGKIIKRPSWFHIPGFVVRLFLGQMADELLLSSQNVIPERLEIEGFSFQYGNFEEAVKDILNN